MPEKDCSLDKVRNFLTKKRHMGDWQCLLKIQSLYWDQISAGSMFRQNALQNYSVS